MRLLLLLWPLIIMIAYPIIITRFLHSALEFFHVKIATVKIKKEDKNFVEGGYVSLFC